MGDDRPDCISLEPGLRDQLICLYPEDTCETTSVSNPLVIAEIMQTDANSKMVKEELLFSPEAALFGIIFANPCQILWDFMTAYLEKMPNDHENPKRSCLLLAY